MVHLQEGLADAFGTLVAHTTPSLAGIFGSGATAGLNAGHPGVSKDVVHSASGTRVGVKHPGDQIASGYRK